MEATAAPPPRWWWEEERWRHWGGGGRANNGDTVPKLRLHELQQLRELHELLDRQKHLAPLPDIFVYTPPRYGNIADAVQTGTRPTMTWRRNWRPEVVEYEHLLKQLDKVYKTHPNLSQDPNAGLWGAAKGWACGSFLLLMALLLLRATDRCLSRGYFRSRRRQSVEWPAASVRATSQRLDEVISIPNMDGLSETSSHSENHPVDSPPPYSACGPNKNEESPPPYSACYVAYPKDGEPSVLLYDGDQQIVAGEVPEENSGQSTDPDGSRNREDSSSDDVTIDIEDCPNPRPTVRLAPIASENMSIDSSEDVNVRSNNNQSC